jgi:hypothetical protein
MTSTPIPHRPARTRPRRLWARAGLTLTIAVIEGLYAVTVLPVQLDTAHLPEQRPDRYVLALLGGESAAGALISILAVITLLAWRHHDTVWTYRTGLTLAWLSLLGVILAGVITGMILTIDILIVAIGLLNAAVCLFLIYTSRR